MKKTKRMLSGTTCLSLFILLVFSLSHAFSASSSSSAFSSIDTWNAVVAKAKEEGKVVISTSHTTAVREAVAKGFKNTFGIEIEYIGGAKGAELGTKLVAERRAGLYLQDIYIGGPTTIISTLKPAGAVDPLEPVFSQPDVLDKKLWIGGDHLWVDRERKIIIFLLMPTSGQCNIINTTMVKPGEISVYDDYLNPKWKNKIIMNDPTVSGPGQRFVGPTAVKIKGWDYIRELVKQKPAISRDQRLQVEGVARGKYAIGLGMQTDLTTEFINTGAPILEIVPEDNINASAGASTLALVNRAAHPNAAKVFINWILGKEGQTILSKSTGTASIKTNVTTDHLRPARRLDPTKKYYIVDNEDYASKEREYIAKAKEIFAGLLK